MSYLLQGASLLAEVGRTSGFLLEERAAFGHGLVLEGAPGALAEVRAGSFFGQDWTTGSLLEGARAKFLQMEIFFRSIGFQLSN
jgi:hypothetical protein